MENIISSHQNVNHQEKPKLRKKNSDIYERFFKQRVIDNILQSVFAIV